MDTFLAGFLWGMLVGPLLVVGLVWVSRIAFVRWLMQRVTQWASDMFWLGVEKLLAYLDELVARRREREADELASPNLIGPTSRRGADDTRSLSAK